VLDFANAISEGKFTAVYDKSLVRGMGYYTGMVFEIVSPKFGSSVAGGGRYDEMIGKFLGVSVPAV
jgi:histidyl-tRNA synthetase